MCSRREWLVTYETINKIIFLGDDSYLKVIGIGVVHFEIYGGMVRELTIHHVSGLRQNLLSLSLLEEVTYYEFSGEGWCA